MKIFRSREGWFARSDRGFHAIPNIDDFYSAYFERNESPLPEPIADVGEFLAPVAPSKVVCVGLNYRAHAEEMNKTIPEEPLLFMKPTTALLSPNGTVELPAVSDEVHHEGELVIVIGRQAKNVSADQVDDFIFGYTIANDVTARDIQRREKRYTRAKGFDTFCPIGPCVVTADCFNPAANTVELTINGEQKQRSSLNDFIFDIPTVVSFISSIMTLNAGDIILTGTPSGVGPMKTGDQVSVAISGIGTLTHTVI